MEEQRKLTVAIYGQSYTLRVTSETEAAVAKVADYVDEMMHKVGDKQNHLDFRDVAVLAAMNITEEYFRLKEDYQQLVEVIEEEK